MKHTIIYQDEYQLVELVRFFDEVGEVLTDAGIGNVTFDADLADTVTISFDNEEDLFRFRLQFPSLEALIEDTIHWRHNR